MAATAVASRLRSMPLAWEVLLVAAFSLALRTYNLLGLPIFVDETVYLNWSLDIWEQRTRASLWIPMIDDGKQPLFMWLTTLAYGIFRDPLVAGRMVSALAGAASAAGVYLAGYWLAGRRVGLVAGLLYTLVPFNLFYDRMALAEALLNTGGVWTFALSVFVAARANSSRSAVLAGIGLGLALGVAIWTKMTAAFMLPFPFLCALLLVKRGRLALPARGFAVAAALFAALAAMLAVAPDFEHIIDKSSGFSHPPQWLLTFPVERWVINAQRYWPWIEAYLPAPLWWLLPVAVAWGLLRRRGVTLLLLGCWASFTVPTILLAVTQIYESRYVSQGVFPLLLLVALLMVALQDALGRAVEPRMARTVRGWAVEGLVAVALFLAVVGPSLRFDFLLLSTPERTPFAFTDESLYITGWPAGYGFMDAVRLLRQRAAELTRDGQPIIVLGNHIRGATHVGLKVYMRDMKGVFFYVDRHLAHDPEGFMAAWKPHHVPLLVIGNEPYDHLDAFERAVPQARRLGVFSKPGGESSFRVYEVALADLER